MSQSIQICCGETARSKSDVLHSVIAALEIPPYSINSVLIFECPMHAKITFKEPEPPLPPIRKYVKSLLPKSQKESKEFTLDLTIQNADTAGHNFLMEYSFNG